MQFFFAAAALALSTSVLAQDVQSAPFNLTVTSEDGKYNNVALTACHEGAAIEGLCVDNGYSTTFTFNTTEGAQPAINGSTPNGILTFFLPISGSGNITGISSGARLGTPINSNVGHVQFYPGNSGDDFYAAFDSNDSLFFANSLDDTVSPPQYISPPEALYRWYMCETQDGYLYTTLNWAYGVAPPQNPSCVKVDVKRVFVPGTYTARAFFA